MRKTRRAREVDRIIGKNLHSRMRLLKIEPERLASRLRLSGYDLHRVLTGQDRLHPEGLYEASVFLGVPLVVIFDGAF